MIKKTIYAAVALALGLPSLLMTSCGSKGDEPTPSTVARTLLVYAVGSNNLYSNFRNDSLEMLKGAEGINLNEVNMMAYWVRPGGDAMLKKIVKGKDGAPEFAEVKTYDRQTYSTDPRRISEVISDMQRYCPADKYDMILCSHGTGWTPSFKNHGEGSDRKEHGAMYSFGADQYNGYTDEIDIDELADAIPDNQFGYIWFDACYMSGIEVIYQLRDKSEYFVGYPTEVWAEGMPYNMTLPYLLRKTPDLQAAASEFFDSYQSSGSAATIVVVDNSKIEPVADFCAEIYQATLDYEIDKSKLQRYSRAPHGPFYELKDYTLAKAYPLNCDPLVFYKALDDFIVWKACSDYDFSGRPISKDYFTGLSCHAYDPSSQTETENYYRELDWFKRVYVK